MAICHFPSKVHCFSGHWTCAIKNVKKRVEGGKESSSGDGSEKGAVRWGCKRGVGSMGEGETLGRQSESFELALLMSSGGCVSGRGAAGG